MRQTSLRGGIAGAVATVVMTLEQPLDQRLFNSRYDDVEILGKFVTRGENWQPIGFALHVQNDPARKELPKLATSGRAFGQATIRHAVFGVVLGLLEDTLNDRTA